MRGRWLLWALLGGVVGVLCYGTLVVFTSRRPLPRQSKVGAVIDLIARSYVDTVPIKNLEEKAIELMVGRLDPHSTYIPAKDARAYNEPLEGGFEGIGITFNMQTDTLLVLNTIDGGPSEKVGILSGDRIVGLNFLRIH